MKCTVEWNGLSAKDWMEYFNRIPQSNVLQHPAYIRAMCRKDHQRARFGLIRMDGQPAGLVSILEAGILWNAIHGVMLDRGPLWFPGFGTAVHIKLFIEVFSREFPARLLRRRRLIPEIQDGATARKIIESTGFSRRPDQTGYDTFWVKTDQDEKLLRDNWRQSLHKAQRAPLNVTWDDQGHLVPWMCAQYAADKSAKGYPGPSPRLLTLLSQEMIPTRGMVVGQVRHETSLTPGSQIIAGVMLVCHGRSATYLAGWTGEMGREVSAHHLLLWQSLNMLKQRGIWELDLGGFNESTAQGVKLFKEGMGGTVFRGVGHYN